MAASLVLMCRLGKVSAMSVCTKHSPMLSHPVARWMSNQFASITKRNIEGFELSSVRDPVGSVHLQPRPLLIMIGWLNAKRKHLRKYQEMYWRRGFDVLTMDVSPVHIVRPQSGIKYTAKLLRLLQEHDALQGRQVVVHGFSIGAFIYTQLQKLLQAQQHQNKGQLLQQQRSSNDNTELQPGSNLSHAIEEMGPQSRSPDLTAASQNEPGTLASEAVAGLLQQGHHDDDLSERIAGLVLDSPAYIDHMCDGIANSVTSSQAARKLIHNSLQLYLAAFPRSVTFHYLESQRVFHHNPVPTLILYSPADPISCAATSERYVAEWIQKGFPVSTKRFQDSLHVGHFRAYPDQYTSALNAFLDNLDLDPTAKLRLALDQAQDEALQDLQDPRGMRTRARAQAQAQAAAAADV